MIKLTHERFHDKLVSIDLDEHKITPQDRANRDAAEASGRLRQARGMSNYFRHLEMVLPPGRAKNIAGFNKRLHQGRAAVMEKPVAEVKSFLT